MTFAPSESMDSDHFLLIVKEQEDEDPDKLEILDLEEDIRKNEYALCKSPEKLLRLNSGNLTESPDFKIRKSNWIHENDANHFKIKH